MEKNVISEIGTWLPPPRLDADTKQSPDERIREDGPSGDKGSARTQSVQHVSALGLETVVMLK